MAMDWNTGNNPWGPGGKMTAGLPWAQQGLQGMQHGWQQADGFFAPKSQAQIQREALLQLAILAAVVAAPALLGAGGGAAGGAASTSTAATAATKTAATTSMVESATIIAPTTPIVTTGTAATVTGAAAASGPGAAALMPFIGAAALQNLLGAAMGGPQVLNQALQQQAPATRPSFVFDPGQAAPQLDKDGRHPAMPMLDNVAYGLKHKPALLQRLRLALSANRIQSLGQDRELLALVAEAVAQIGPRNPWAANILTKALGSPFDQVDQEEEEDDQLINVALFPPLKDFAGDRDSVLDQAYLGLMNYNKDTKGINGWKVIHVNSAKDAIDKLAKRKVRNLIIFSHGEYRQAIFYLGDDEINLTSIEGVGLERLEVKNIVVFACFIANPATAGEKRDLMRRLAQLTKANVYGNEGYSYPDATLMWNSPPEIKFVIAGVDYLMTRVEDDYILEGAGRWVMMPPVGDLVQIHTVYFNNNGTFGHLRNAWEDQEIIKRMIAAAKQGNNEFPVNDMGGSSTFPNGAGGDKVPTGGGVTVL